MATPKAKKLAPVKAVKSKAPKAAKQAPKTPLKPLQVAPEREVVPREGWLQDASLEVPVPTTMSYNKQGQRELEFSVGMRQQEADGLVRSELRARALIHANGAMLVLAEASFVNVLPEEEVPANLASKLYDSLKPHMESLLALGGHTPPLPESLEKVA